MDLGIAGKKAIVCAASKGLGKGCARALAGEGVGLVINARTAETLEATAREIAEETGASVTPVAADIASEAGRAAVLAACPDPDILVTNCGGPPAGDFRDWGRDHWIAALDANMLTPIALIQATVRRHDRARVRAHRQHHLVLGEGALSLPRPVERRAHRPDRLRSPAWRVRPCATT